MALKLCDIDHEPVAYDDSTGRGCPFCNRIENYENLLDLRDREIRRMEDEIKQLDEMTKGAKNV